MVADAIIGHEVDRAVAAITGEGFVVRDLTDAEMVQSDFNPERINIWTSDDIVEFATVG